MSWQNKLDNIKFSITTGDGKKFTPLWRTAGKSKEFNASIFDFIEVEGSLVDRKKAKSAKHTLTFYFQGENNIEDAADFDASALDPRAWVIVHPLYGSLRGQPLNIAFNEDSLNVTEVTVDFWESINADYPDSEVSVKDTVEAKKVSVLKASSVVYASDVTPASSDITKIKTSNSLVASSFGPVIDNENNADFLNAASKAISSAENLLSDPLTAIEDAQSVLDLPASFSADVKSKLLALSSAYEQIKLTVLTVADKLFFEAQAAACIASMCIAAVNPSEDDYVLRTEIEETVETILAIYTDYLNTIDNNQVQIYNIGQTYIPNVNTQIELYSLVAFATGNLYNFAFEAKQLRTVHTDKNTNVILLTHRYIGLANDENLDSFIKINNIKLKELFVIKKGREIKYFV